MNTLHREHGEHSDLIRNLKEIPSIPFILTRIQELLDNPDSQVSELSRAIEYDIGLSTRILRVSNSAIFGMKIPVCSLQHAIVMLGFDEVRNISTSVAIQGHLKSLPVWDILDTAIFWKHSIAVACASKILAEKMRQPSVDAFTVGLLHEIGKCALASCMPEKYQIALGDEEKSAEEAEFYHCGINHTQVGELLCEMWKLPDYILRGIGQRKRMVKDPRYEIFAIANDIAIRAGFPEVGSNRHDAVENSLEPSVSEEDIDILIQDLPMLVASVESVFSELSH